MIIKPSDVSKQHSVDALDILLNRIETLEGRCQMTIGTAAVVICGGPSITGGDNQCHDETRDSVKDKFVQRFNNEEEKSERRNTTMSAVLRVGSRKAISNRPNPTMSAEISYDLLTAEDTRTSGVFGERRRIGVDELGHGFVDAD